MRITIETIRRKIQGAEDRLCDARTNLHDRDSEACWANLQYAKELIQEAQDMLKKGSD